MPVYGYLKSTIGGVPVSFAIQRGTSHIRRGSPSGLAAHNPAVLLLDDPAISADHALISAVETGCYIADLGSANGTRLQGRELEPRQSRLLRHGDEIKLGSITLTYERAELVGSLYTPQASTIADAAGGVRQVPVRVVAPLNIALQPRGRAQQLTNPLSSLMQYLPPIYHGEDLINDLLLVAEAGVAPEEDILNGIQCYTDPRIAPVEMLSWLASWFGLTLEPGWTAEQRRKVVWDASFLIQRRGTREALLRWVALLTGLRATIIEYADDPTLAKDAFRVELPPHATPEQEALVKRVIEREKPVGTTCEIHVYKMSPPITV